MTAENRTPSRDRKLCGVLKRQGDGTCARPAGWGTDHVGSGPCKLHGGTLPVVSAHHRERLLEATIAGELEKRGWEPITDPLAAYADLAGEVWAFKELCRERIAELRRWEYTNGKGDEDIKPAIAVYERSLDRASKQLLDMLRLGLDHQALRQARERPTRELAEGFNRILEHVLAGLDLTDAQRGQIPGLLAEAVRKEQG